MVVKKNFINARPPPPLAHTEGRRPPEEPRYARSPAQGTPCLPRGKAARCPSLSPCAFRTSPGVKELGVRSCHKHGGKVDERWPWMAAAREGGQKRGRGGRGGSPCYVCLHRRRVCTSTKLAILKSLRRPQRRGAVHWMAHAGVLFSPDGIGGKRTRTTSTNDYRTPTTVHRATSLIARTETRLILNTTQPASSELDRRSQVNRGGSPDLPPPPPARAALA